MSIETETRPDIAPIREGLLVFTADNRRLGRVKDLTDTHFKVDVRFGRDYWLARDRAVYVDDRCVGMHFRKDELELYRLSDPFGTEFSARQPTDIRSARERMFERDVRGPFPL